MRALVTGARGFIGSNLCLALDALDGVTALPFDVSDDPARLPALAAEADYAIHLAGVNRPSDPDDFARGNRDLTATLLAALRDAGGRAGVAFASSTQAALDNPYGKSKREAEALVQDYARATGAPCAVFRFTNVFGKGCRPYYNSAVATFCHRAARGEAPEVRDENALVRLLYVDDAVAALVAAMRGEVALKDGFAQAGPVYETTVGALARTVAGFARGRTNLDMPDVGDDFTRKLYATYLSHLPEDGFAYPLAPHADARGSFTEAFRFPGGGQVSVNVSRPGVVKGEHWHHTKVEKFLVVSGRGVIRFRRLGSRDVLTYPVSGDAPLVVDIPPGYTHNIENLGDTDMVTLMWASEPFDPARPDTYHLPVNL